MRVRHGIYAVATMAVLIAGLAQCSVIVDANRTQCSTDSDCAARGPEFAGSVCAESVCQESTSWACLATPAVAPVTGTQFKVSFLVRDAVTQRPKVGLSVRLCRRLDVACVDAVSSVVTVDEQGNAAFQVDAGFNGYARFDGGDSLPGMYFFNPPVERDTMGIVISLSSPATAAGLASLTGVTLESDRGIVLLSVVDCTGTPASGIVLASTQQDARARTFYSQQGFPSAMATTTDDSGYGGIVNASPGTITFSALLEQNGKKIDETTVLVQAGTQTMTTLVPHGS